MTQYELIMYSRSYGCPFITTARRVLNRHGVAYREIFIDRDPVAKRDVRAWTGFESVPTLVIARQGEHHPCEPFTELERGASPRGIDRGPMITEATEPQLEAWLKKHGFIR